MCRADNLNHLHVLIVLKSGSLNLLEPSGPVQECNGIALPLTLPLLLLWCRVDFKLVPYIKRETQILGVSEQDSEKRLQIRGWE